MKTLLVAFAFGVLIILSNISEYHVTHGQYFHDVNHYFVPIEMETINRGQWNISTCLTNLLNCWEVTKADILCSAHKYKPSICDFWRDNCHDTKGRFNDVRDEIDPSDTDRNNQQASQLNITCCSPRSKSSKCFRGCPVNCCMKDSEGLGALRLRCNLWHETFQNLAAVLPIKALVTQLPLHGQLQWENCYRYATVSNYVNEAGVSCGYYKLTYIESKVVGKILGFRM